MYIDGSAFHSITSIFSPFSSFIIFWILTPFCPTHDPTGSMFSLFEYTATLLLYPGSRDTLFISISPSYISGISNSNNFLTKSGHALDTITCGVPFIPFTTSSTYPLTLLFTKYFSVGICSFLGIIPSNFPKSITIIFASDFCTSPETISPFLSLNSVYTISLSASLNF